MPCSPERHSSPPAHQPSDPSGPARVLLPPTIRSVLRPSDGFVIARAGQVADAAGWWWVGGIVAVGVAVFVGGAVALRRAAARRQEPDG